MKNTGECDLLQVLVDGLLIKYKDVIRSSNYSEAPEDFWQDLRTDLRYSSPVVSGLINYTDACKWAKEQINRNLDEAAQLFLNKKLGFWRVRFVQNNRFLNPDDVADEKDTIQPLNGEILCFATYSDADLACKKIFDSYKSAMIECPAMELVPFDQNKNNIVWLCHQYRPNI